MRTTLLSCRRTALPRLIPLRLPWDRPLWTLSRPSAALRALGRPTLSTTPFSRGAVASFGSKSTAPLGRRGDEYLLSLKQIEAFHRDGYIALEGVLTEEEVQSIEAVYDRFISGDIVVPGKDFCDMAGDFSRKPSEFSIVNAMLPRVYYPPIANNIYEKRSQSIMKQLWGDNYALDYDQFLAKRPSKSDAVFAWHSDLAYWPWTPNTDTATFSLALDATTLDNGCLRFVVGSHKEKKIRSHKPAHDDRSRGHALVCDVDERSDMNPQGKDIVHYAPVSRGSVTIHGERIIHGSGPNLSKGWRRTYVVAFRHVDTIKLERQAGFTHSHNDTVNWDTFERSGATV